MPSSPGTRSCGQAREMQTGRCLCVVITCLLTGAAAAELSPPALVSDPPLLKTRHDVDKYLYDMEQLFKVDMNKEFIGEYTKRKRDAGIIQTQIEGLGQPVIKAGLDVSATDFFTFKENNYAVISERTLNESYVGRVTRKASGALLIEPLARFSVQSFIDSQYRATFQTSLQRRVIEVKAHVYGGQVFIMIELESGMTLLFLISHPERSWVPKYQDSVLSADEVASDFAFFEQTDQLFVIVTVSHMREEGKLVAAHTSYIYRLLGGIKWLETHTVATPEGATSVTTFSDQRWTYIIIGQSAVQSLVYRMHWDTSALELFQYLPSSRALSVQAFTHNTQTYVLLANQYGAATVFWWTSNQLYPWQSLDDFISESGPASGQVQFGHVGNFDDGESFIYIISGSVIYFYTTFSSYTGHFSLATKHGLAQTASVRHVQVTRVGRAAYYLLATVRRPQTVSWTVFPVLVRQSDVGHPSMRGAAQQPAGSDELLACLDEAHGLLAALDRQLDGLLQLADSVFVHDAGRNVTAAVTVTGSLVTSGQVDINELHITSNQSREVGPVDLGNIRHQIAKCNTSIGELNTGLHTALTTSTAQTITGHYSFSSLEVQGNLFINEASDLETLNGVSYQRLIQSTLTFSDDQVLSYPLTIGSGSVTNLTLTEGVTVNGMTATDLMHVSGTQTVAGHHRYRQVGVGNNLGLTGPLNGLDLTSVVQLGQTLTVPEASLTEASVETLHVTNINQRELSAWQQDSIRLDRPHTFLGHFNGGSASFSDLRIVQLNGRHLDTFLQTLWKSPNDGVAGVTTFSRPPSVRELAAGRVNGVTLATDLLTTDTDQLVTSHLRLHALDVTLDLASDWINGLDISEDVVRTTGTPNTVSGSVVFAGDLVVTGDVTLGGDVTVNGVDISGVSAMTSGRRTLHFGHSVLLNGHWTVHGAVTLVSINGYSLAELDRIFWTKDGNQDIPTSVTVTDGFTVNGNLTVGTINGASTDSLINVQTGGTIENDIVFLGNVTVNDVTLPSGGTLNDYDLSKFAPTVVTRGGDQFISGVKTFSGVVQATDIVVDSINTLRVPKDILLVNKDAIQTGSLTFLTDPEVLSNVSSSGGVSVSSTINGHRVDDILANLTNVWVNRTTNHVLIIEGNVHFHDVHVLETLNTAGLLELLDGLLYLDRDTVVPGNFTVNGDVRFNSQLSLGVVNGLPWTKYLSSLILSDVGGTVSGTTTVTSSLTVPAPADILVTSLNGYTQQQLYSQYLTLNTDQIINHRVIINGAVSADVLHVNTVNGVPVDQLMFTDRDLHFYQSVHFFSDVSAYELSLLDGSIGECNLTKVWESGLRRSGTSQRPSQTTTIGSLTVNGDVSLTHSDVMSDLLQLIDGIVTTTGDHVITGQVTFDGPVAVTSAEVASYNGLSVAGLCEDALTTDAESPVKLAPQLTLLGSVTFDDVTVTSDAAVGLVNGERLGRWAAGLVLQPASNVRLLRPLLMQNGAAGHVLASGLINGMPQSPWVEIDSTITANVYFDNELTIIDNLDVSGLVDGVNITSVLEAAVDLMDNTTIPGDVVFNGDVAVWMNLNTPQINDVPLSDLVLTHQLDRMQVITGDKHFDTLHVTGAVCGLVNGVNLTALCGTLLSSAPGSVQVVNQHLSFQHQPANMAEPGSDLAENLTTVTALLHRQKADISLWMADIRADIQQTRTSAAELLNTPDYSVDLAYLVLVQWLPVPYAASVRSSPRELRSVDVLLRSPQNCSLPAGCLCRYTATLQIHEGGLLSEPVAVNPGQTWTFHIRQIGQVFSVTALTDGYSARCQSPGQARLTVTRRPAEDPSSPATALPMAAAPAGHVTDVLLRSFHGRVYMVLSCGFARGGDALAGQPATQVLLLDGYQWRQVQTLPAYGATALDLTMVDGVPHLLVVNRYSREPLSLQGEVQLWVWNEQLKQFSELKALFHADIQAVAFLHAHDKVFVVIADLDGLTVLEYSPELRSYAVCQYLAEPGVSAMTSFVVGAESYLVVFSAKLNEIVVFLVTHQEGLRRHCWYPATAVRSLAVYTRRLQLFLAAVHRHGVVVYRVVVRGRLSLVTTSAARLPLLN